MEETSKSSCKHYSERGHSDRLFEPSVPLGYLKKTIDSFFLAFFFCFPRAGVR
jgi:hypothetical protein